MRLKFAVASATGRTRCGEFVDQKDEHKLIVVVISDENFRWKNGFAKVSYFFLLTSHFPPRCISVDSNRQIRQERLACKSNSLWE